MALLSSKLSSTGRILEPQHVMVYGPPKVGKTRLIGNLAKEGFKLLWCDLEQGISTLLQGQLASQDLDNIQYVGMRDTREEPIGHSSIDKLIRGGKFSICELHGRVDCMPCKTSKLEFQAVEVPTVWGPEWYDWILVIDSGTQLSMSVTNTILKGKPIDYQETLHDFRNQGNYLNRIFTYLQQAPFHVIITAHEAEAEREDGTMRIVPSLGTRNYSITCGKFFDHIVYLDKVNKAHKAYSSTAYSNKVLTGSRLAVELDNMKEPSLASMFKGTNVVQSVGAAPIAPIAPSIATKAASTLASIGAVGAAQNKPAGTHIGGINIGGGVK